MQDKFFGELTQVSNKRFTFDGSKHESEDEITIVTNNVRRFKDNLVLVVDNDKVVYLKDWQAVPIYSYEEGVNASAVKLNRNFFKTYTWKGTFIDFNFEEEDTFESLQKLAEKQANEFVWKNGHYGKSQELKWLHWM